MRKSWKDSWRPGEKEREAFEDMDAIVARLENESIVLVPQKSTTRGADTTAIIDGGSAVRS